MAALDLLRKNYANSLIIIIIIIIMIIIIIICSINDIAVETEIHDYK
jgi:hypothetical protein